MPPLPSSLPNDPYQLDDPYSLDALDDPYQVDGDHFTADQRLILAIHPWALLMTFTVLSLGGLYAGILSPILSKISKRFNSGYAHESRWATIVFSAVVGLALIGPTGTYYYLGEKAHTVESFVNYAWLKLDYWRYHDRLIMPSYLFWYIYGSFAMNLVMCAIFAVVARWDKPTQTVVQCSERHGFIIVAHNSSHKLAEPIKAILKFAKPHQIFIADNGSTEEEQVKTRQLCRSLSTPQSQINVAHIKYGNKTLAQYACVFHIVSEFIHGHSDMDIVTMIDDDVFIPETFPSVSLEQKFQDPTMVAIAYPLRIGNANASTYATLQDAEYFTGNVARFVQDKLGSQLFASGAISTWKIDPLLQVLQRHCTAFNGEDLEMGVLLHRLCDNATTKLGVDTGVRIGLEPNCVVPTTVPVCVTHYYDFLPGPLRRKWQIKACSCGEASFFNQRLRSWDPACHAYFWKFLKVIFSPRGGTYGPNIFIRVLCAWKVLSLLREYLLVFGIVFSFIRVQTLDQLADLGIFYADSIMVSWACGVLVCWTQSLSTQRQKLALRPDIVFAYPVLLELPYGLVIRPLSALYSFAYYLYFQQAPPSVRKQLKSDPEKATILETVWSTHGHMYDGQDNV